MLSPLEFTDLLIVPYGIETYSEVDSVFGVAAF